MKNIADLMPKIRLEYAETLFPPTWENILSDRCPLCARKLKVTLKGMRLCTAKFHKPFVLMKQKYEELIKKL